MMKLEEYREVAIQLAALRQIEPRVYVLECRGPCHKRLTATETQPWRPTAKSRLIARAERLGWDVDAVGTLSCADCHRRMLERAGNAPATSGQEG